MELRDFGRADKLWNRGIRLPATDPYAQFMRIKDRIQAVRGVQVTGWTVGKLQTINQTNRCYALLDVQDSGGEFSSFGMGLEWQAENWMLKTNPFLPSYVMQCVDGSRRKEGGGAQ
jgi:hypothetical protein